MAFPNAAGHPDYSGLLVPEIWSPRIVEKFYEASVLEHIANTNWEGEIANYGDKVNIRLRPNITIREYEAGQDLDVETPDQPMTELVIDRGLYWNFLVEDVNRAQSDIEFMEEWTEDASESLNEETNEIVLGEVYADVDSDNQGGGAGRRTGYYNLGETGTPVSIDAENVIGKLGEVSATLSEAKVPESKRWGVIPSWFKQMIFDSSLRNALITGNDQSLARKNYVGELAGFKLFESNQLAMTEDGGDMVTNILFGHETALTFASQLVNSEVIRSEKKFGRFARGLSVFGFKVVKPDAMALLYAKRAA